jgi:prepilin-type N-terminal cleavage/methylation domain-containing protein/prepilin-type processing-associated H-X9-DG protein
MPLQKRRRWPSCAEDAGPSGFTLVELLVVIAIIGVLTALSFPAIQKLRESASRSKCANNLRQIGLAAHQFADTMQRFPEGMSYHNGTSSYLFMSWLTRLLPYLDQPDLWTATQDAYQKSPSPFPANNPPHVGLTTVVPTFVCPADPRAGDVQVAERLHLSVALTSYLGVEGIDLFSRDGILFRDSAIRIAHITDGTSNTLLAGERPPSPDFQFGWWYAAAGQQTTGSADMVLGVRERNAVPYAWAPCAQGAYSFGPGLLQNQCDMFHFWSLHPGGANFVFADGSVHFLNYSADSLLPALATRAGGEAVAVP